MAPAQGWHAQIEKNIGHFIATFGHAHTKILIVSLASPINIQNGIVYINKVRDYLNVSP